MASQGNSLPVSGARDFDVARQQAEGVEAFGDDLAKLCKALDRLCERLPMATVDRINDIPNQECLDTIAKAFQALGDRLCRECDWAEEADDRRRDNPIEPDFRRLGQ